MGRRLRTADGQFAGVIVATLIPAELRRFFTSIDVGLTGSVWVFHPQGLVLIHEPSASDPLGDTSTGHPIFDGSRHRASGTLRTRLAPGGRPMLNAFVTVKEPPLVVAVSLGQDEVLAEWRREVAISIATFVLTALICATVIGLLLREIDARSQAQERAARSETARRVADARAALADELKRKNKELEAFSYSVAHDLRAPLRAMNGFASILLEDYADKLDAEGREYLQRINESAVVMAQLIDALLSLSQVTRSELQPLPTDLSSLAHSVARRLAATEPDRAVDIVVKEGLYARNRPHARANAPRKPLGERVEVHAEDDDAANRRRQHGRRWSHGLLRARQRSRFRHGAFG